MGKGPDCRLQKHREDNDYRTQKNYYLFLGDDYKGASSGIIQGYVILNVKFRSICNNTLFST